LTRVKKQIQKQDNNEIKKNMATGASVKNNPETAVRQAVGIWAKADAEAERMVGSAVWKVIKACFKAKQQGQEEGAIKTYVVSSVEDTFGEGMSRADKRGAHISKILKVAFNCVEADFARWEKAGTGFYKAYDEFATKQANPAGSKKIPDVVKVPVEKPAGWVDPALGTEEKAEAQNAILSDPDAMAEEGKKEIARAKGAEAAWEHAKKVKEESTDPTAVWATYIGKRGQLWTNLIKALGTDKSLTADMIYEVFTIMWGISSVKVRGAVEKLMQDEDFSQLFITFYKDNLLLYEEEVVDPGVEEPEDVDAEV
jgi:hypothetical protein